MRIRVAVAILFAFAAMIWTGPSNAVTIGVFADLQGTDPVLPSGPTGLVVYYVVINSTPGSTAAGFSAPFPDCFPGGTYLADTAIFPVTIGDSQTGVSVGFGACLTSPIVVLSINVFASGVIPAQCCPFPVLPHPDVRSGLIEVLDCNNQFQTVNSFGGVITGLNTDPILSDFSPPDGASQVSLLTQLTWSIDECPVIDLGISFSNVYFGTDPDPPFVAFDAPNPYDPGVLLPNTTYYWKVSRSTSGWGSSTSPIMSFTTESSVAVRKARWGAIKAIYAD